MKKYGKIVAIVMLVISLSVVFVACNKSKGGFEYIEKDNEIIIKAFQDNSQITTMVVPDEINGMPVVKIDTIGLANSEYLEEITIGKNIREIAPMGVQNNQKLKRYKVAEGNTSFKAVDGALYTIDGKELVSYPLYSNIQKRPVLNDDGTPKKELGKELYQDFVPFVKIADGVEIIRPYAFYHARAIEKIEMADSVKIVGEAAFLDCWLLNDIKMSKNLEVVEKDAFTKNSLLTTITFYENIKEIKAYAFYSCKNIKTVNFCRAESDVKLDKKWYPSDQGKNNKATVNWNFVA